MKQAWYNRWQIRARDMEEQDYLVRARRELQGKNPEEAVRLFRVAARQQPESGEVFQGLGEAFLALGNEEEAVRAFRQALALAPDDAGIRQKLGETYARMGRYSSAIVQYKRAMVLPDTPNEAGS